MTERDRRIKEKLLEDLLCYLPILIDDERRRGSSESAIRSMEDNILDHVNALKRQLKKSENE